MAVVVKKCRHPRGEWDSCGCAWLIRSKSGGRDTYTPAGATKAEAEAALARLSRAKTESVGECLDAWYAAKARDPQARHNSLAAYRTRIGRIKAVMGHHPVRSLRPENLTAFVESQLALGLAPASVTGIYTTLTASLRHAQRRGVIAHLPLPPGGVGISQTAPRQHTLSLKDIEDVIERMPGVHGAVAELVLLTGLRWGEVVALEPGDVDGHFLRVRRTRHRGGGVNAPKTAQGYRVVPLSERARQILGDLELPVGGSYAPALRALTEALGPLHQPGIGWHVLRNAHASLLDAAGVSLRDTAARMGHGHHFAQSLAYGLATEAGDAGRLDEVRHAASLPSGAPAASRTAPRVPRPGA